MLSRTMHDVSCGNTHCCYCHPLLVKKRKVTNASPRVNSDKICLCPTDMFSIKHEKTFDTFLDNQTFISKKWDVLWHKKTHADIMRRFPTCTDVIRHCFCSFETCRKCSPLSRFPNVHHWLVQAVFCLMFEIIQRTQTQQDVFRHSRMSADLGRRFLTWKEFLQTFPTFNDNNCKMPCKHQMAFQQAKSEFFWQWCSACKLASTTGTCASSHCRATTWARQMFNSFGWKMVVDKSSGWGAEKLDIAAEVVWVIIETRNFQILFVNFAHEWNLTSCKTWLKTVFRFVTANANRKMRNWSWHGKQRWSSQILAWVDHCWSCKKHNLTCWGNFFFVSMFGMWPVFECHTKRDLWEQSMKIKLFLFLKLLTNFLCVIVDFERNGHGFLTGLVTLVGETIAGIWGQVERVTIQLLASFCVASELCHHPNCICQWMPNLTKDDWISILPGLLLVHHIVGGTLQKLCIITAVPDLMQGHYMYVLWAVLWLVAVR